MKHEFIILASVAAVYIPMLISPGPNFLVLTQVAVNQTPRHAFYTAVGIASGSTIMAGMAAAGMGLILAHFAWFTRAVQCLGGIYMLYIAINIWRQATQPIVAKTLKNGGRNLWQSYCHGLFSNLSNPKALVFFATIFASLLTPSLPGWVRLAGVGVICVISMSWNITLAKGFSGARMQNAYRRAKYWINRITAVLLLGVGVQLIFMF